MSICEFIVVLAAEENKEKLKLNYSHTTMLICFVYNSLVRDLVPFAAYDKY